MNPFYFVGYFTALFAGGLIYQGVGALAGFMIYCTILCLIKGTNEKY